MSDTQADTLHPMHFKLCCITRGADFAGEVFEVHEPKSGIHLVVRERPKDAVDPEYVAGDGIAEAACTRQVPKRLATEVRESGELSINKQLARDIDSDLYGFTNRVLRIIRWRRGEVGDPDPIRLVRGPFWSFDSANWRAVTTTLHAEFGPMIASYKWIDIVAESIKQAVRDNLSEPLAHELLLEARALHPSNLRSSIVLTVTAAEVGFKQFAIDLVPGSKWLVENIPSPPLLKMLRDFLPTLPIRRKLVEQRQLMPESLLAELEKAVKLRNEVIHGGRGDLKGSSVGSAIKAVRDLLYLLNGYSGDDWAFRNVSGETIKELTSAPRAD